MKVKRNPVVAGYSLVGGIVFSVMEVFYIWLLVVGSPPSDIMLPLVLLGCGGGTCVVILWYYYALFSSNIEITPEGLKIDRPFRSCKLIKWEECPSIGIRGYYYGIFHLVYFSSAKPDPCLSPRQYDKEIDKDWSIITIGYSPRVMEEILRYVPKDRIRGYEKLQNSTKF